MRSTTFFSHLKVQFIKDKNKNTWKNTKKVLFFCDRFQIPSRPSSCSTQQASLQHRHHDRQRRQRVLRRSRVIRVESLFLRHHGRCIPSRTVRPVLHRPRPQSILGPTPIRLQRTRMESLSAWPFRLHGFLIIFVKMKRP